MDGRNLSVNFSGSFSAIYARTDNDLNTQEIKDVFRYTKFVGKFINGVENNESDLLYHATRQYLTAGGPELIDFDAGDLVNVFGDELRFENIKAIIIRNNETDFVANKQLQVVIQSDSYVIGPTGHRVIWEPAGLVDVTSGSLGVAGLMTLLSSDDISYDLIAAGSSALVNLVSSGS